ncbi:DEAD/DEAH box helicase [Thalassospira xiamenensis M-5 = DSM 17429]|uniref:DEAD/DEAH box helicase n=2 Tax=Thalassospira xiamenensis TaxID=220697 RepID=A0AB72UF02_9PROT|nr:DEAD/DEAH box helicase [Thalassospira xiamenensis M-5 = DSM 17429]
MRPEANAQNVLSTTRARAKMHEFRVPEGDFNELPRDPAILFGLAIAILGEIASAIADQIGDGFAHGEEVLPTPAGWREDGAEPQVSLRFASTFFDSYINAELDVELTPELSLLCATTYYISGSVGSAAVIVRQMEAPSLEIAGGLAFLLYSILQNQFQPIDVEHNHHEKTNTLLGSLVEFFNLQGDPAVVATATEQLRRYFQTNGSPRELLFADLIGAVCALKLKNAARTILPIASRLDIQLWRSALEKPRFPLELWPAQKRIAEAGVLEGRSVVIQMPTSAGKTRATELIIRSAFLSQRARLAVIVAPYRSLCHDIRGDLVVAFSGENIRLDEASDSYQFDLSLDALFAAESVLVLTPEKLLYMLRRAPELADQIGLMIYDEGHQFDGMARGPTYELLLTSLRMALRPETQIILISAVIGNAGDVAEWLIGDREAVLDGVGLLPTSKSIAFSSWQDQRGRLEYVDPQDPDEREFYVPRVIEETVLQARGKETAERRFPTRTGSDVGLFLGLHVVRNGSVAVFCGRKDSVTTVAKRAVDLAERNLEMEWPIAYSDSEEVESIRALAEYQLGANAPVTRAASLGIFSHSADTPHGLRLSIEHAMKFDRAKFVVCTSTLAQGVNFPLKYLIVTSTRQGGEDMLVRDFHNLMGRAGRAGMHTEGSVIFSAPATYDQRNRWGRGRHNWGEAVRLLDPANSEPSSSAILGLFEPYTERGAQFEVEMQLDWLDLVFADTEKVELVVASAIELEPEINSVNFRKFINRRARVVQNIGAFLTANMTFGEGEDADEKIAELATSTLAYHLADENTKPLLLLLFRVIGESIAANTDAGERSLIRRSPLPPRTITALREWLVENLKVLKEAASEGRLLEQITPTVLAFVSSSKIAAISDQTVIPRVLDEWVSGHSFARILTTLLEVNARVGGRRLKPKVEDVVALCEGGFGYDAAMIVASIADLAEDMDETLHNAASLLQRQIKTGLTDAAALAFHEAGFADRHVATFLGQVWPHAVDRGAVHAICQNEEIVRYVLPLFPSYFTAVAAEVGGWEP